MYISKGNYGQIIDGRDELNRRKVFIIIKMKELALEAEHQKLKESSCDMICSRCSRVDCKNR